MCLGLRVPSSSATSSSELWLGIPAPAPSTPAEPAETQPSVSTSQKQTKMFNTSGPVSPQSQSHPLHFFSTLSLRRVWSWSPELGRRRRRSAAPPRPRPGSETPQFLSCMSRSVSQSPSRPLSLSLSLSVRGIKKIATSIMNFCSLSLLSTVAGILR